MPYLLVSLRFCIWHNNLPIYYPSSLQHLDLFESIHKISLCRRNRNIIIFNTCRYRRGSYNYFFPRIILLAQPISYHFYSMDIFYLLEIHLRSQSFTPNWRYHYKWGNFLSLFIGVCPVYFRKHRNNYLSRHHNFIPLQPSVSSGD